VATIGIPPTYIGFIVQGLHPKTYGYGFSPRSALFLYILLSIPRQKPPHTGIQTNVKLWSFPFIMAPFNPIRSRNDGH
jgi:hypothetical protein